MKITKRDIRLLLYVFGVLVFVATYFLIYTNVSEKNSDKEIQNMQLEQQLTKLQLLAAKQKEYKKETDQMQTRLTDILNAFPADVRAEDGIAYGQSLESVADMTVNGITIGDKNLIYTFGQKTAASQGTTAGSATTAASTQAAPSTTTAASTEAAPSTTTAASTEAGTSTPAAATENGSSTAVPGIYLYGQNFTYQFTSSYQGLKQVIDSIQKDTSRKNIDGLSLSYDSESGLLIGTLSVTAFSLAGTDKVYEPVYLPSMSLGQDNLFGTINHTQEQDKK